MKLVKLTTTRGDYKEIKASSIEEVKTGGLIVRDAFTGVKKHIPKILFGAMKSFKGEDK